MPEASSLERTLVAAIATPASGHSRRFRNARGPASELTAPIALVPLAGTDLMIKALALRVNF
jgi:hypothetical protein